MPVEFRYAQIEIDGKPVLVDKQTIADASQALRDSLEKVVKLSDEITAKGFALQTPDGMEPVILGDANSFAAWLSKTIAGATFDLKAEIDKLPEPLKGGLTVVAGTKLVLYSAVLFSLPADARKGNDKIKAMYGEIVFGFRVNLKSADFPVGLNEIVIAVNNFSAAA